MGEGALLQPGNANLPRQTRQIYDPVLGAFRTSRVPPSLSTASTSPDVPNGHASPPTALASPYIPRNRTGSDGSSWPWSSLRLEPLRSSSDLKQRNAEPSARTNHVFMRLPTMIYECIVQQLEILHDTAALNSCHTCYMRDLYALALVSRAWDRNVVKQLYGRIILSTSDLEPRGQQQKNKVNSRLKLLRRTLRARASLAQLVKELHISPAQAMANCAGGDTINQVASLVMCCPDLEQISGFHVIYGHEFDRLTYALSTRRRLRQHVWLIGENTAITERSFKQLAPGLMDAEQKAHFVSYHDLWPSLTTLFLHSPQQGILEKDIFVSRRSMNDMQKIRGRGILHRLPSLQHLCISSFDMDDFDDWALQQLPAVQSLRLEDLEGVTFWGLSEWSRTRGAFGVRRLSLVNIDVLYISAISNLLLRLENLIKFTLVQDTAPEVPAEEVVIQPIMASARLEFLHWDILVPGTANENLVSSVRTGGFPRLRKIRAPSDHYGDIQALCKPRAQIELPSDMSGKAIAEGIAPGGLRAARRAAQQRLENAWTTVQYKVIVEEAGTVNEVFDFSGFMGTVGSKIDYCLDPDQEGSDEALIGLDDLMGTKALTKTVAKAKTCTGSWNRVHPQKPRCWEHAESTREVPIDLMKFF